MSREVKRVPLNFKWYEKTQFVEPRGFENPPKSTTWFGYTLEMNCQLCHGQDEDCPLCYGDNLVYPKLEPPEGAGWQMWETISEGSPISPVFKSPEELAKWLADNEASALGHNTATYQEWLSMINTGFAMPLLYDINTDETH